MLRRQIVRNRKDPEKRWDLLTHTFSPLMLYYRMGIVPDDSQSKYGNIMMMTSGRCSKKIAEFRDLRKF